MRWVALVLIAGCATYQAMDMKKVPKHPRPDSAAQFPQRTLTTEYSRAIQSGHSICMSLEVLPGGVRRVYDGDTYFLYNVGVRNEQAVRELGINAPELKDSLGATARDSAESWLRRAAFTLQACNYDSFGRLLGISSRGADTLGSWLINLHLAVRCLKAPCPVFHAVRSQGAAYPSSLLHGP
jgi:endonuclease YncB( thermonuclease family)